jgi:hypothetical protein
MFVHPMRRVAQGAVISAIGAFGLVGCGDPDQNTDLRPEGPPDVLTVLVHDDSSSFGETATYCKTGDEKRPRLVGLPDVSIQQVCPENVTEAVPMAANGSPTGFFVRFQFDELLDPNIETLTPVPDTEGVFTGSILPANPIATFECGGVAVDWDGYYSPSGNSVTWPLGPSLVVVPTDPSTIAADAECTISLAAANIKDKEGVATPDSQAFTFALAGLDIAATDPEVADDPADAAVITADSVVSIAFTGFVDPTTLAANEVILRKVTSCEDPTTVTTEVAAIGGEPGTIEITDAGATAPLTFDADAFYVVEFAPGATVEDAGGAMFALPGAADFSLCFGTEAP